MSKLKFCLIEAMGMHAENQHFLVQNGFVKYGEGDFTKIIEDRGLGHNDLVTSILQSE